MASALMLLGDVEFSIPAGSFETLDRETSWHIDQPMSLEGQGAPDVRGRAADTITIKGVAFPGETGTAASVSRLRDLGDTLEAQTLTDGAGRVLGSWAVASVSEGQSHFIGPDSNPLTPPHKKGDGGPRKLTYTLKLTRSPDEPQGIL